MLGFIITSDIKKIWFYLFLEKIALAFFDRESVAVPFAREQLEIVAVFRWRQSQHPVLSGVDKEIFCVFIDHGRSIGDERNARRAAKFSQMFGGDLFCLGCHTKNGNTMCLGIAVDGGAMHGGGWDKMQQRSRTASKSEER